MNDTTIYDLIQSLGDKHNAVEEIISHCTDEYKKMTSTTKSGTVSKTQDYAADALVMMINKYVHLYYQVVICMHVFNLL